MIKELRKSEQKKSGQNAADLKILDFIILLGLICGCYMLFVHSFFSADDLWQVHFAHRVVSGELDLLWLNFYSNYMQLPGFDFYRPILGVTFALDYLISRTDPLGYHLTSIFLFYSGVVILYLLVREITDDWPEANSRLMALASSALFAVSPLNAEDVVWISGRADTCCLPFFLASILFGIKGLKGNAKRNLSLALVSYIVALGSKELAIVAPALVFSYYVLWKRARPEPIEEESIEEESIEEESIEEDEQEEKPASLSALSGNLRVKEEENAEKPEEKPGATAAESPEETKAEEKEEGEEEAPELALRVIRAIEYCSPYAAVAAAYLAMRFFVFGNSLGGYTGSFGVAMRHKFYWRWIEHDMIARLLVPFPDYVDDLTQQPRLVATIIVAVCIIIGLLKVRFMEVRKRLFIFIGVWCLVTILPVVNLLILDADLRNSRLLMLFTIPISMLWPALLFHPTVQTMDFALASYLRRFTLTIGTILMMVLTGVFSWCTFEINKDWQRAGDMVNDVWKSTIALVSSRKQDESVILLGLPSAFRATHVIYNGSTFYDLLKPPFVTPSVTDRVVTFLPYIVGPGETIDASRLKMLLADTSKKYSIWRWNDEDAVFYAVHLTSPTMSVSAGAPMKVGTAHQPGIWRPMGFARYKPLDDYTMEMENTREEDGMIVTGLNINPLEADFLEFDLSIEVDRADLTELMPLSVSWGATGGNSSIHAIKKNPRGPVTNAHLRLRLSNNWRWYTKEHVDRFIIQTGTAKKIVIKNITLTGADHLVPAIAFENLEPTTSGEHVCGRKEKVVLLWDNGLISEARDARIQISNLNYFFNNTAVNPRSELVQKQMSVKGRTGRIELPAELFKTPGYYQVRVYAVNEDGKATGEMSDALTLYKLGNYKDTYIH